MSLSFHTIRIDLTLTVNPYPQIILTFLLPMEWIRFIKFIDPPLKYINLPLPQINRLEISLVLFQISSPPFFKITMIWIIFFWKQNLLSIIMSCFSCVNYLYGSMTDNETKSWKGFLPFNILFICKKDTFLFEKNCKKQTLYRKLSATLFPVFLGKKKGVNLKSKQKYSSLNWTWYKKNSLLKLN